jgi:hypothetical protein
LFDWRPISVESVFSIFSVRLASPISYFNSDLPLLSVEKGIRLSMAPFTNGGSEKR